MKSKKMPVIYDSGWVREPDDDNEYDNEYDDGKQHRFITITVRGAVVYTVAVMVFAALVTILLLDIV